MQLRIIPDIVNDQKIFSLKGDATVSEAAKQMVDHNVAAVVIVDHNQRLVGIMTERDMTRRVLAKNLDADSVKLEEVMTKNPDTLAPDDSALDALELMRTRKYRHLPVADGDKVVGMVSIRDLYAAVKVALEENIRETEAFVFGDRYGA